MKWQYPFTPNQTVIISDRFISVGTQHRVTFLKCHMVSTFLKSINGCAVVCESFLSLLLSGIGSGSAPLEQCLELAQRPGVLQHWTSCKHLIIDEISMVEAQFFDKLEAIAR